MIRRILVAAVVAALLWGGFVVRGKVGANGFVFAGSDSYGYDALADTLRTYHRYAYGPAPAPLEWVRPPGYPIWVALVKGDARAEMKGGPGWGRLVRANVWLEVLGTGLVLFFAVRRWAGDVAALIALALLMLMPFNAEATAAALTESLATFLDVSVVAALLCASGAGEKRARVWLAVAGALLAVAALVRPDALILAPAFAPAVWQRVGRRARLTGAGLAVAGFAVVFAPWPVRNLVQFGAPHPLGGRIDLHSRVVEHYQGSWAWLRAFAPDWRAMTSPTTCLYDVGCPLSSWTFQGYGEWDSPAEQREVERLAQLRRRTGNSQAVSDGFQRLADERLRRHPFRTEVTLPLRRLWKMWVAPHDELVPRWAPTASWRPRFEDWARQLLYATLFGALLCCVRRELRTGGVTLTIAVFGRALVLAWTFYCMPRYLLEEFPLAYALVGGGTVALARTLVDVARRARARFSAAR